MRFFIFSPAKINTFLHITGVQDSGYHNLQSVFLAMDFGDRLQFIPKQTLPKNLDFNTFLTHIHLFGADGICAKKDNLMIKAAFLLYTHAQHNSRVVSVDIIINKRIPQGAGLGGGSSNAAATLFLLNRLWCCGLDFGALVNLGKQLGADVPFFIGYYHGITSAHIQGIGDDMQPIITPKTRYLLLMPHAHICTKRAFLGKNLQKNTPIMAHDALQAQIYTQGIGFLAQHNAFEQTISAQNAQVQTALDYLCHLEHDSSVCARMSGTGACVFLPLVNIDDATANLWQKNAPCAAILTQNI